MANENSRKVVIVGLTLQDDRDEVEDGPADYYLIPAAEALLDAPRNVTQLRGEGSQHVIGVVPLAYHTTFPLTIFGYPEKSGLGALLAMAIGPDESNKVQGSLGVYAHVFTPTDLPPLATLWRQSKAGELKAACMGVNRLTIKVPEDKEMQLTADLLGGAIAISEDLGEPEASDYPDASDGNKIFRSGILQLTYGGEDSAIRTSVKDLEITIDRKIQIKEGQTQDMDYPSSVIPNDNILSLKIEALESDFVEVMRSFDGLEDPAASSPATTLGLTAVNLKYVGPAAEDGQGAPTYTFELDIPAAHVVRQPINKGGREGVRLTITPVASPADVPYTVTLVNTDATPYFAEAL